MSKTYVRSRKKQKAHKERALKELKLERAVKRTQYSEVRDANH